ncbi:MAG TPA: hypothetical protein VLH40_09225 [Atribacteraceae bacterium]|nr:hypothetical protein [Atribacteraceae bacterium]
MKTMRLGAALVVIMAVLTVLTGCQTTVSGTGTIRHVELSGGFYGIVGDDGLHYEPINLPREFWEDGLRIAFTARPLDDWASIYMWGRIVEILSIEKTDT